MKKCTDDHIGLLYALVFPGKDVAGCKAVEDSRLKMSVNCLETTGFNRNCNPITKKDRISTVNQKISDWCGIIGCRQRAEVVGEKASLRLVIFG